jgi:hypothetical protein
MEAMSRAGDQEIFKQELRRSGELLFKKQDLLIF